MDPRHRRGSVGERMAELFLEARGYRVLERRLRTGAGEIDLLIERGELLIAVEVKWRRGKALGGAGESWHPTQRRRAGDAALLAMSRIERGTERPWRFDLVTIEESERGVRLEHRPGVWSPGSTWW